LDRVKDLYPVRYRAQVACQYPSPVSVSIDTRRGTRINLSKPAQDFLVPGIGDVHIRSQ
jgi:hypothetical protein